MTSFCWLPYWGHFIRSLHWDSNHHITAKQSVFNTLAHRAKTVSSTQENMDKELLHIKTALHHCQFPAWALNQWLHKFNHPNQAQTSSNTNTNLNPTNNSNYKTTIVVPYITNTAKKFKKLCRRRGIQVHFKATNTLRTALGNPKDKDPKANQAGIIYKYHTHTLTAPVPTLGNLADPWEKGVKEHLKAPSPIHLHSATSGHPLDPNHFNIVHKEVNSQSRTIKEAMFICIQDPPQQKLGQVPTTAYMGPALTGSTNILVQANTAANNHINPITPLLVTPILLLPTSPATHLGGDQHFFHYYSQW